jgi:transcription initiation factor TFIIB
MASYISNSDLANYFDDFNNIENNIGSDKAKNARSIKYLKCPNCQSTQLSDDYKNGNRVCVSCGQVVGGIIDYTAEWRHYDEGEGGKNVARCGAPTNVLLPQSSLGTVLTGRGKGMARMKQIHAWGAMPYDERSKNGVYKKIQECCRSKNILKCIEDDAKIMYKMVCDTKFIFGKSIITRGINRISIIAACVYYACKKNNMARTTKEIAKMFDIEDTAMNNGRNNLKEILQHKKHIFTSTETVNIFNNAHQFVKRYCNELKIKDVYIEQAVIIAKNTEKLNIASVHTPFSIAAASILLMSEINNLIILTKKIISNKFKISEITITKAYKKMYDYRNIILDDKLTDLLNNRNNLKAINVKITKEIIDVMGNYGLEVRDNLIRFKDSYMSEKIRCLRSRLIKNITDIGENPTNIYHVYVNNEIMSELYITQRDYYNKIDLLVLT